MPPYEDYTTILKIMKPHDLVSPTNIKGAWKEEGTWKSKNIKNEM